MDSTMSKSEVEKKRREETSKKVEEMKAILAKFYNDDRSKKEKVEVFEDILILFKQLLIQSGQNVDLPPLKLTEKPDNMARKPFLEKQLREKLNYYYDAFRTLIEKANNANCTNLDKLSTLEKTIACIRKLLQAPQVPQMMLQNVPRMIPAIPLPQPSPIAYIPFPFAVTMPLPPHPMLLQPFSPFPQPKSENRIWRPFNV
ncbi:hypothetical protein L596_013962 [Steinernema carpocapsae]|uniref:BHLH domain-containing protein n=1 Tax=Steinernema carpocapsae TaxID=34508 RepID=A0A4V6A2J8_STECR|nr:hypothetical protein L596_013962 [Steinernema carpocapsae]